MTKPYMEDIPVKNKELLGILERYRKFMRDPLFEKNMHRVCQHEKDNRSFWVGERHLKDIVNQGHRHEGFPETIYGYEVSVHRKNHEFFDKHADHKYRKDATSELASLNNQMMSFLGTRHNALTAVYPPGGFISWHNNANAAAYNLIFSWSENGSGRFKYVDPVSKEVVEMEDHEGWQCKAAYFGRYDEPEHLFYHAAETDCWRITVSFTFNTDQASLEFREDVLEDIRTE
jgi:hypothetical protein